MEILLHIAMRYLNIPYKWGGKSPLEGLDCSGCVSELLKAMGVEPPHAIWSAQDLYDFYGLPANHVSQEPQLGCLLFYGANKLAVDHVAMGMSRRLMIEAGGGTSQIVSVAAAIQKDARVRVRPIRFEKLIGIVMPEYPEYQFP